MTRNIFEDVVKMTEAVKNCIFTDVSDVFLVRKPSECNICMITWKKRYKDKNIG